MNNLGYNTEEYILVRSQISGAWGKLIDEKNQKLKTS
jgi:hypothetical protein